MKEEGEEEPTEPKLPKGTVVLLNGGNALLSLFTSLDPVTRAPLSTRTVIVTRQSEDQLVLLDNIHWYLYISVPQRVPPRLLKRFMINSYCSVNYVHPYASRYQQQQQQSTAPQAPHGYYPPVCNNRMISDEIKDVVYAIDTRNDARFADYCERIRPPRKKWRNYWEDDGQEDAHDDGNDAYPQIVEEEVDEAYQQMIYCAFDRDVDLVRGLYNGDYNRPRLDDPDADEEAAPVYDEEEDLVQINEELYHTYGREYVQKRLPGENQYRLVFNNHTVLHYFVSRFMRKEIVIEKEGLRFSVRVLEYVADRNNVRSLTPLCKQYAGSTKAYTEGQFYQFKNERDVVAIRLDDGVPENQNQEEEADEEEESVETEPTDVIRDGLLHPSDLESYGGQGCSYNCTQYGNRLDQMYPARHATSKQTMGIQTLYIDLSTHTGRIRLMDYRTRRNVVPPVKQLNEFMRANGLVITATAADTSTNQPIKAPGTTPTPPARRTTSANKRIRNQPAMGDFVERHQVKLSAPIDVFERLDAQRALQDTVASPPKRKSPKSDPTKKQAKKQKKPATKPKTNVATPQTRKVKKAKIPHNVRDRSLFFEPYPTTAAPASAAVACNRSTESDGDNNDDDDASMSIDTK